MLPDLPHIKEQLQSAINDRMRAVSRLHLGPLADVKQLSVLEGDKAKTIRHDGTSDSIRFQEIEAEVSIGYDEAPSLTPKQLIDKMDTVAAEMGEKQLHNSLEGLSALLDASDRAIAQKGGPISAEGYFEVLEYLAIDFDDDGTPHWPTIICHPAAAADISEVFTEIETTPDLKVRMETLLNKKREEARARQVSRQLVG